MAVFLTACTRGIMLDYSHDALDFDQTPEQIDTLCQREQTRLLLELDAIGKQPKAAADFSTSVLALERSTTGFNNRLQSSLFLKYVSSDPKVRAAADRCETAVSQMMVDIFVREDLFNALKACKDNCPALPPVDALLLDEFLIQFKRNGLELPPEKRKIYVEKKKRLVVLEAEFATNLVEYKDFITVTRAELAGLPETFIDSLEKTPTGELKVSIAYPHFFPVMENGKVAETRRKLELKFFNKGGDKNRKLLEEAIGLRDELAKMLGYKTHAEFVLERRMAKTPATVMAFLERLKGKLILKGKADLAEMLAAKKLDDPEAKAIESHDWRYYENLLRKTKYQVDYQRIKEYFPLDVVTKGMFEIYEKLLDVKFEEQPGTYWYPGVKQYRVLKDGKPVAYFFMDLFPRDGKYGHAAAFTLISGYRRPDGKYQTPVSAIVANFNPPAAGKPSLLDHGEVETLFHEFGHIMHQVLTTARYASFSGTSVKTDYVEAPSQMLENWVWAPDTLAKLSGHHADPGKPLPKEDMDRLIRAKLLNSGIRYLRQLAFALIDMDYHSGAHVDSTKIYKKYMKEIMLIPIPDGVIPQAGFGHLMGGYDAGYYGYLWSEVYAQDMFSRFENEGMLNAKTGTDYRKWILEPGGEQEPIVLIRGFLNREPNEEAFLKSIGL